MMIRQNNYFNDLYELLQRDFSQLEEAFIDLSCNGVEDEGAYNLTSELNLCLNLTFLNIDLMENHIGPTGCLNLSLTLNKLENLLTLNLNLSNNSIGDEGVQSLVSNSHKFQSLTSLNLQIINCGISQQGTSFLGKSLVRIATLQDLAINISTNNIKVQGLKDLCSPFFQNQELQIKFDLDARYNNTFKNDEIDFQNIFSLNSNLKSLTLNLIFFQIINFGKCLVNCVNLLTLSLEIYQTDFQDQLVGIELCSALAQCKNLNSLFLSLEQEEATIRPIMIKLIQTNFGCKIIIYSYGAKFYSFLSKHNYVHKVVIHDSYFSEGGDTTNHNKSLQSMLKREGLFNHRFNFENKSLKSIR
ncbi:hypothetical protein ABPG74_004816 [Tetrahymena malaccensis]